MSTPDPVVSIVVPCHNYAHTLPDTIESITHQTFASWEVIIVNDGSTDNTQEIIENLLRLDSRIIGIQQKQSGVSAARNAGASLARGQYLLFLDADDLITPNKLTAHLEHFNSDPAIDISYSYCQYFHTSNPQRLFPSFDLTQKKWMLTPPSELKHATYELVKRNLFVISSPLIKKASLPGGTKFKVGMTHYEDWLYWFSCAAAGLSFHYCPDETCQTLIRVHKVSAAQNSQKMFDGIPALRREMAETLAEAQSTAPLQMEKIKKTNIKYLKKWCYKKLGRSGASKQTLKDLVNATDKKTAYLAITKFAVKNPSHFLTTFFKPR